MQNVLTLPVVSNAHVKRDSEGMASSALISMNARCLIHAEVKDQDVSIPQDPSDVFVSRDIEVNDLLLFKLQEKNHRQSDNFEYRG